MIDADHLGTLLLPFGFNIAYIESDVTTVVYIRRNELGIFERLVVLRGTKRSKPPVEIISAGVECSIVPGRTALKGLCIQKHLMVLSEEQQGWSEIRTDDQVRHWQSAFVAIAPEAVREYASEVGPELLDKTAAARIAVSKYLRKLTPLSAESINAENVHGVLEKLFPDATEEHIESMNKVMKYPMIMIEDGKSLYETVVLAIVRFCDEVESQRNWLDMHPIAGRDRELMVRIQLMASLLAPEVGWPLRNGFVL
ncbi:MAG: hypothetical protein KDA86_14880 [Planctomycetaceae bacterium]|nr:hypothetical protein [Planctomycetaceae bacterium]